MDFIILSSNKFNYKNSIRIADSLYLFYEQNHEIKEREFFFEDENSVVLSDTNIQFNRKIKQSEISEKSIENNINLLTNGYVIFVNKSLKQVFIYTDIFGFYHLFYLKSKNTFFISSDFRKLLPYSELKSDPFSVLDVLLFNYTLLDRTTIKDIKRITGGNRIQIKNDSFKLEVLFNYADNFTRSENTLGLSVKDIGNYLNRGILNELAFNEKNTLTMTGGFDSRTLLASLSNQKIRFDSFTFGQKGNIEIETIKPFINNYSINHELIELDNQYISDLGNYTKEYINLTLDCPTILDLPHYLFVKKKIAKSNLIAGFMGGEILSGQSIGSEVTFTQSAAKLLLTKNISLLKTSFLSYVEQFNVFEKNKIISIIDEYINSLSAYFFRASYQNILRFLINEEYSKFFGSINKVFKNHSNLIVPYMDKKLIDGFLNSKISFLNKQAFRNKPQDNFKTKIFQSRLIKSLNPSLGNTKLDRLYSINDLCYPYRFPIAIFGYIKSHVFKSNKKSGLKPHFYDKWYSEIVTSELSNSDLNQISELFSKDFVFDTNINYPDLSSQIKKRLTNIMAFNLALKEIIKLSK